LTLEHQAVAHRKQRSRHILSAASTFSFYASGSVRISHTVIPNQWYHVAVVKSSGVTKFYLNGAAAGTTYTDTIDYGSSAQMTIGVLGDVLSGGYLPGYVSDVRITKSAIYTTNFTPPTQPLDVSTSSYLLKTTNGKVIDQTGNMSIATVSTAKLSTTQSKFGGTGIAFNGSSDYLALSAYNSVQANIPALHLGVSNFTIEGWVFPTSFTATKTIFFINGLGTAFAGLRLDITTERNLTTSRICFWFCLGYQLYGTIASVDIKRMESYCDRKIWNQTSTFS